MKAGSVPKNITHFCSLGMSWQESNREDGEEKHCSSFSGLVLNTSVQWEVMNSCISQKSGRVVLGRVLISNGLSDQAAACSQLFEQWTSCKGCINQRSVTWIHACERTCEHLQVYCGVLSLDLIRGVLNVLGLEMNAPGFADQHRMLFHALLTCMLLWGLSKLSP